MTASIDLLRHGDTGRRGFCGSSDDGLSARGWAQMSATLTGRGPWDAVITSPLARCAAFAREYARAQGLPLAVDARLREMHFGEWEGLDATQVMARSPRALENFWRDPAAFPPPGAETLDDFSARVRAAWREIAATRDGARVLVITHGGVIRVLLGAARGLAARELLELDVPHASLHRLPVAPIEIVASGITS